MRMLMTVVEVVMGPKTEPMALRSWAVSNIRGGDGLVVESGRVFLVLPDVHGPQIELVLQRLRPGANEHGADLVVHPEGTDEAADSIRRRATAQVLPVNRRGRGGGAAQPAPPGAGESEADVLPFRTNGRDRRG